ncbi:ribbon-helix-helix domain-containing protein [Alphaproteobacteria bacterium]|nr:ribbon-helix-helix domain-containing protein [Alphaproteobacteria bacterium]
MLIKKSITLKKHRTSLSLEKDFWEALNKIAENENSSIQSLISEIDINRKSSLASSTRVFILQYFKHI